MKALKGYKQNINTPPRKKIRAVAFDLDGTILNHQGVLFESIKEKVKNIISKNIKVFLNTGRMPAVTTPYWKELNLNTPMCCANGAYIGCENNKPLYHKTINKEVVEKLFEINQKYNYHINYYIEDIVYLTEDNSKIRDYLKRFVPKYKVTDKSEILQLPEPTKALMIFDASEMNIAMENIKNYLGNQASVIESGKNYIEIMAPNVDKANSITFLAEKINIPIEEWLAVGDGMNDYKMIKLAGVGMAIKGGEKRLEEVADFMVEPLWENGIEKIIEYLEI